MNLSAHTQKRAQRSAMTLLLAALIAAAAITVGASNIPAAHADEATNAARQFQAAETVTTSDPLAPLAEGAQLPPDPTTPNSWRYANGERLFGNVEPGVDGIAPIASPSTSFTKDGSIWRATFAGKTLTIKGAYAIGVDVSHWNGAINWARAKKSIDFALIQCGYGVNYSDQDDANYLDNVRGCKSNEIPFGVYLYSYAETVAQAQSEADHVLRLLRDAGLSPSDVDYPIYYDLEESSLASTANRSLFAQMATAFCTRIEQAGYRAGVYANRTWWENYLTDPVFDRWERWVAEWLVEGREDAKPRYTGDYAIWQCLSTGAVDGINGSVDINFDYSPRYYVPFSDRTTGAVFRLYNGATGEHLFTQSLNEAHVLLRAGWGYEGRCWTAPSRGVPVYRLYNPNSGEHLYTADVNEYSTLGNAGWNREDIQFYSSTGREVPIYRLYNPRLTVGTHLFTRDENEYRTLAGIGWQQEGVALYGVS